MPRPHLSDHQKLAQARAEIARLRKVAGAKAEPLTAATRRKLEGELIKVKLENDRLREQLAAKSAPASSGEIALLRQQVKVLQAEIAAKPKPAKPAPQPRVFLTFSPSIEGHPISGTLMDRYGSGKAKIAKEGAKEGTKEGTQEDAQEDTQEDARLTLLHRLPRRHDLDLRRLAATADEITLTISGGIIFSRFAFAGPLQT